MSRAAFAAPPDVKYLFPAGAARGASVQVTAGGNPASWPARVWVSRPGVTIAAAEEKGKFSVTVAEEAAPGVYWVRIYNAEGAAAPLPFIVGNLPEINEQEPNDSAVKPQSLSESTCTINGRLEKRGDVDTFAVTLKKGQTLVAAVTAHETLGSPMDAVVQIVSPRGTTLAQNDDERGLDPLLTFIAPADGVYLVRIFAFPAAANASISFAGGETFVYRLTVTSGGFLDAALPLAISRTQNTTVEAYGWNLADADKRRSIEPLAERMTVDLFSPQWAGALSLPVVEMPTKIEVEPNDAAHPQTMELPVSISGRIGEGRDQDAFRFHLAKGKAWRFKIESRALGYPLDSVLRLVDSSAKTFATSDDAGKNVDSEMTYTAPADADYTLIVSDLYQHGGPRYFYRLSIEPLGPDFALSVPQHAYTLTIGKPLEIPVTIDRRQSFSGDIELAVLGLPDSVTVSPAKSVDKGETAKTVKLTLTATAEFSVPIRIMGKATDLPGRNHLAESPAPAAAHLTDLWLTAIK